MLDRARVHGMEQIDDLVYYDSNGEETDENKDYDSTFYDTIQVESAIYDTSDDDEPINGETINNDFKCTDRCEQGVTGLTIDYGGVLHAHY